MEKDEASEGITPIEIPATSASPRKKVRKPSTPSTLSLNLPSTLGTYTQNNTASMSSMRNAVQRRNHKERAQPLERQKWGILEKHKDYSLRAKDHNAKKRKLNALKAKAADRNEDEFYFGMMSSESKKGVKVARRGTENSGGSGRSLRVDVVKLMKTQDVAYLRTVLQRTRKEIEGLDREVVAAEMGVDVEVGKGRVVFGEDGEDLAAVPSLPDAELDDLTDLDLLDGDVSDEAEEDKDGKPLTKAERAAAKRKRHALDVKRGRLEGLQDRAEDLATALREVEDQRVRMSGRSSGVNKNGTKFKTRQRAR